MGTKIKDSDRAAMQRDPYEFCIAHFEYRTFDREARTVTFHFRDTSALTFNIRYEVRPDEV